MCLSLHFAFITPDFDMFYILLAGGAFGGNRGVRPVPPEKGVFPLDHMHLCDQVWSVKGVFCLRERVLSCLAVEML